MEENLSLYHIFYVTAREGNISRAARELFISQPAISKAIRKLEENLETVLFIRTSRGVTLTREGELLYRHVAQAFDTLQSGEALLERNRKLGVSQLRIGASTTLCRYILLPHLKNFVRLHPHVKVSITCQSTFQTLALLDENKIDIGLVGKPEHLRDITYYDLDEIEDIFDALAASGEGEAAAQKDLYSRLMKLYVGDLLQDGEQNEWALARATTLHNKYMAAMYAYIELLKAEENYA